jgi:hypothetical protein
MDFPEPLVASIRSQWAILVAHPEAFAAVLIVGLMLGWAAAWLILNQRLTHHRELVDHYKEAVAGKAPIVGDEKITAHRRFVFPLFMVGALFMLIGVLLAYSTNSAPHAIDGIMLVLLGLLLTVLGIALAVNPTLMLPDKTPTNPPA